MDEQVLCGLLADRIPAGQFRLRGPDVQWTSAEYDTPENRAIVADVVANYDALAAAYVAEQAAAAAENEIKTALTAIDLKSIRSLREWLAAQPDAPQFILDHEAAAIAERAKLPK
jgi:hypothetical protein